MNKVTKIFKCNNCGETSSKWAGKCFACEQWGTLEESKEHFSKNKGKSIGAITTFGNLKEKNETRLKTNIIELDRCLGEGIVSGSVILLGGDPGVGKSTLALQAAGKLLEQQKKILYVCGEESPAQIKMRAERLELDFSEMALFSSTDIEDVVRTASNFSPDLLVIDSVQTLTSENSSGVPGSVSQVSNVTHLLIQLAKTENIAVVLVGHVTKEGYIAGPKTLEHMVDVVLYLEGEKFHNLRLLRAAKNRFGTVNEVGVFEMSGTGLKEVANPSELFLEDKDNSKIGAAMTAVLEGTRVIACEIQALLSSSSLAYPKRTTVGFSKNRLWLILAVLSKHGKVKVHEQDVYVNVAGGLKINESGSDLAVAAAIISSAYDLPLEPNTVYFGEMGLSGEIRPVGQIDRRLKEAERLGFKKIYLSNRQKIGKSNLEILKINSIQDFLKTFKK